MTDRTAEAARDVLAQVGHLVADQGAAFVVRLLREHIDRSDPEIAAVLAAVELELLGDALLPPATPRGRLVEHLVSEASAGMFVEPRGTHLAQFVATNLAEGLVSTVPLGLQGHFLRVVGRHIHAQAVSQ